VGLGQNVEAGIPENHCQPHSPQLRSGHKRYFRMLRMRFGHDKAIQKGVPLGTPHFILHPFALHPCLFILAFIDYNDKKAASA
jgi:hypothetical protein